VYKKGDLVYINDKIIDRKSRDEINNPSILIYTLEMELGEKLLNFLRPYKKLNLSSGLYKLSVLEEIDNINQDINYCIDFGYSKISEVQKQDLLQDYTMSYNSLVSLGIVEDSIQTKKEDLIKYIEYDCDIVNYLEEVYGDKVSNLLLDYSDLSQQQKDFLNNLMKETTKERKLKYIKENLGIINLETIYEFIPSKYLCDLKIFGLKLGNEIKELTPNTPEFKVSSRLDGDLNGTTELDEIIKREIYNEFKLGEVTRGSELKTRLSAIYRANNLNKTARLVDLLDYFVITKAKSEYEWFYRIVNRKIL